MPRPYPRPRVVTPAVVTLATAARWVRTWSGDGRKQMSNVWKHRDGAWSDDQDVVGYDVEATDGSIGRIDASTAETDRAFVVVDTGMWIFGKKRIIPAGLVTRVDHDAKTVTVTVSKDQVRAAPDYEELADDDESMERYAEYYSPFSW
jgi:hypothetical protein